MKRHPFLLALLILGSLFGLSVALFLGLAGSGGYSPASLASFGRKVAVVEVRGIIMEPEMVVDDLIRFRKDESVKAIVLRVDSPGGGVGPSQEIYQEVRRTVAVKPVVVSMGSVAASGGYYVSAPASFIFANPGTITGSIGVIMEFPRYEELMEKIGVARSVIKSGPYKDIGSYDRPMKPEEEMLLQGMITDVHGQFVEAIASGRKMEKPAVLGIADGRIFSGQQAKEAGLVDQLGGFRDAVAKAASLAGIEGDPQLIYPEQKQPDIFKYLVENTMSRVVGALEARLGRQEPAVEFRWRG